MTLIMSFPVPPTQAQFIVCCGVCVTLQRPTNYFLTWGCSGKALRGNKLLSELLSCHAGCHVGHFKTVLTVFCEVMGTGRWTDADECMMFFWGTNFGYSEAHRQKNLCTVKVSLWC